MEKKMFEHLQKSIQTRETYDGADVFRYSDNQTLDQRL